MEPHFAAAASLLLALAATTTAGAVTFNATDAASGTGGGQRFEQAVGLAYASHTTTE